MESPASLGTRGFSVSGAAGKRHGQGGPAVRPPRAPERRDKPPGAYSVRCWPKGHSALIARAPSEARGHAAIHGVRTGSWTSPAPLRSFGLTCFAMTARRRRNRQPTPSPPSNHFSNLQYLTAIKNKKLDRTRKHRYDRG